jgi:HSP20 family protein
MTPWTEVPGWQSPTQSNLPPRVDMAVIPKDPLDWLTLFRQQINEIFTFLSTLDLKDKPGDHEHLPFLDSYETEDEYVIEVELPGFDRRDISLNICCNTLVIEGLKREEPKGKKLHYICLERCFGRFCRAVEIPPAFDSKGVKARYDKGLLSVAFPRLKEKSTVIRNIPIE